MKLIDEKGRLFGKLNIIDLLIVFVILAGLLGVNYKFGFIKTLAPKDVSQSKNQIKIWVKDVSIYTADAIFEGDTIREVKSNSEIGKVIKKEVEPYKEATNDLNGKWILSEVPERYNVFITIENDIKPVNGDIKLGSKEAKAGTQIDIKGSKFQSQSYIAEVK